MKIHYAGEQSEGWGWGVFGINMVRCLRELGAYCETVKEADFVLQPVHHDFRPVFPDKWGDRNLAMSFFESPLENGVEENIAHYEWLFIGSTWCKERCAERGITNTEVLIQGVDRSIFKPHDSVIKHAGSQFRIFSGGKFEYRKGQDLVIVAFREFAKDHPEAHLVCSWFNPWPQLILGMRESKIITHRDLSWMDVKIGFDRGVKQEAMFSAILQACDLSPEQFAILPQLSHADLAREMANTDCGLFPNRCEGGTNLVLMEYAACGGCVIATEKTGHRDITELIDVNIATDMDAMKWAQPTVASVRDALELAHEDNEPLWPKHFPTWESAAKQVLTRAEEMLNART